jgi:DNA-binding XRE family transcriptional regulator
MIHLVLNYVGMSTIVNNLLDQLKRARKASYLTHDILAQQAGVSRMTVQRIEAGKIDPRLPTLFVLARALGMDVILVPRPLRQELENFVRSGGRFLGQPAGIGAPLSVVNELLGPEESAKKSDPLK